MHQAKHKLVLWVVLYDMNMVGLFLGALNAGNSTRRENRDNRDDHQKFY